MGKRGILKQLSSAALELAGLAVVNGGFWSIHTVVGLFATGLSLMVVGFQIDPPRSAKVSAAQLGTVGYAGEVEGP